MGCPSGGRSSCRGRPDFKFHRFWTVGVAAGGKEQFPEKSFLLLLEKCDLACLQLVSSNPTRGNVATRFFLACLSRSSYRGRPAVAVPFRSAGILRGSCPCPAVAFRSAGILPASRRLIGVPPELRLGGRWFPNLGLESLLDFAMCLCLQPVSPNSELGSVAISLLFALLGGRLPGDRSRPLTGAPARLIRKSSIRSMTRPGSKNHWPSVQFLRARGHCPSETRMKSENGDERKVKLENWKRDGIRAPMISLR